MVSRKMIQDQGTKEDQTEGHAPQGDTLQQRKEVVPRIPLGQVLVGFAFSLATWCLGVELRALGCDHRQRYEVFKAILLRLVKGG